MPELRIPNRFESLQATFGAELRPLIFPIDQDLKAFLRLREHSKVQGGGVLSFLLGPSGIGKTTAVHSAVVNLPDDFVPAVVVPPSVPLREAVGWITTNLPPPKDMRTLPILFDGREVSDDTTGVKQFLSGLNQLLRHRENCVFFWPTTDEQWHATLQSHASKIGGSNFAPAAGNHKVAGPSRSEWPGVFDRILAQFDKTLADVGLAADLVKSIESESHTIGEFLGSLGAVVSDRIAKTRELKHLPTIVFVITSGGDVVGEANRVRRAGTQSLASEPLLGYSPRSEAGKWWTARNENPSHHLGYILSLFQARLLAVSASCVVHACMQHGADDLRVVGAGLGLRADKGNAARTMQASEIYRFLMEEPVPEFTSGRKGGGPQQTTQDAYATIQSLSATRHKAINQAICSLIAEHVEGFAPGPDSFEVCCPTQDVITDVVVPYEDNTLHLEFHHLSEARCRAANMASYIMDKLRGYAIYHNLIPR